MKLAGSWSTCSVREKMEELAVLSMEKRWPHRILTAAAVCLVEPLNRRQTQALHSGVWWEDRN